jgi:hypothetical protein
VALVSSPEAAQPLQTAARLRKVRPTDEPLLVTIKRVGSANRGLFELLRVTAK